LLSLQLRVSLECEHVANSSSVGGAPSVKLTFPFGVSENGLEETASVAMCELL
jgi:hypothetical protein